MIPHPRFAVPSRSPKAYQNRRSTLSAMLLFFTMLMVMLHGCVAPPPESGLQDIPAWKPPENTRAWQVDSSASHLRILVYRDGPLARFGHNHVIDFDLHGTLYRAAEIRDSGFMLEVPLHSVVIDSDTARADEGEAFAKTLSEQARRDTRNNMLGDELLAADRFPRIRIESVAISGAVPQLDITLRIHVRNRVFERTLPAHVDIDEGSIHVDTEFGLTQTGLGLEQYMALGGGLQVADRFTVKLQLLARSP